MTPKTRRTFFVDVQHQGRLGEHTYLVADLYEENPGWHNIERVQTVSEQECVVSRDALKKVIACFRYNSVKGVNDAIEILEKEMAE